MVHVSFDPQLLPIDSIGDEAALAAERLTPAWLRTRFSQPPQWTPEDVDDGVLRARAGQEPAGSAHRAPIHAAVLIPLVQREAGLTLLLTRRTASLSTHPGQVSFPGGRAEPTDATPIDTALRETEEEVGLARRHVEVLGTLPDYYTGTGYLVTPVVALLAPPFELRADPGEVAEIFEVPLAFLMNGQHHQRLSAELPVGRRSFYAMPYQRFYIWGATAGMLRNLFHFLRA